MATTKRDQIIDALLARMLALNPNAQRNYIRLIDTGLPALAVWDGVESASNLPFGTQSAKLQINIAMAEYLEPTDNPSKIGNEMLGKLIMAAIATDPSLGGLAVTTRYQSSNINYPEPGGDWIVGVDAVFEVEYRTQLGNPYA